jgi:hypothetical protein
LKRVHVWIHTVLEGLLHLFSNSTDYRKYILQGLVRVDLGVVRTSLCQPHTCAELLLLVPVWLIYSVRLQLVVYIFLKRGVLDNSSKNNNVGILLKHYVLVFIAYLTLICKRATGHHHIVHGRRYVRRVIWDGFCYCKQLG